MSRGDFYSDSQNSGGDTIQITGMSGKPVTDSLKWDTATPRNRIEQIGKVSPSKCKYFMEQDDFFIG